MKEAVEQCRGVACGEYEAVAIQPLGIVWIIAQKALPEAVCRWGGSHRGARMTRMRFFHSIYGKSAQRVDTNLIEFDLLSHGIVPVEQAATLAREDYSLFENC